MALTPTAIDGHASSSSTPELPGFSAQTRLLVIAPHPDDETIANGLLIQRVRAAGGEVRIVLLTAGENNPWPQRWLERRWFIGAADRRRWGQLRHVELGQALQQMDVSSASLQTLGWPDMGVTDVLMHGRSSAIASLAATIAAFRPSLVAMPSVDDRHPDHGSAHVLTRLALAEQRDAPLQLAYLIHGCAAHDRSIDVTGTPEQHANKRKALDAHGTQMALSGHRMRRVAERTERYWKVSPVPLQLRNALPWRPPVWLRPMLQLSVVDRSSVQTWPWSQAPLHRDRDGTYQLSSSIQNSEGARFARLTSALPSPWIFDHWGWCEI